MDYSVACSNVIQSFPEESSGLVMAAIRGENNYTITVVLCGVFILYLSVTEMCTVVAETERSRL